MRTIEIGDTYAIPLPNGRFGICRIIGLASEQSPKMQKHLGKSAVCVTATHFSFDSLPYLEDVDPETNLYVNNLDGQLTSRDPKLHLIKSWVAGPPPDDLVYLGNHEASQVERQLAAFKGSWKNLVNQWSHER